ncbi:hypothetical protein N018_10185 [Pseudomonas syringae CC1557]|uniref:Secreted protein n=1 Tax=Pseudomonas syringae CC1557 TaxID=1357279 RepID=W0MYN7_PSESX|nr:hypothetical protein N018_10185 [Pseudomonas syringae CC1557]
MMAAGVAFPFCMPCVVTCQAAMIGVMEEMSGFHEARALSLHMYKKAGKDGQEVAGDKSGDMTKTTRKTTPKLSGQRQSRTDISRLPNWFCAGFAHAGNEKRDQHRR